MAHDLTVGGYNAIFDANGVSTLQESYNHVLPGGRLVSYGKLPVFIFVTDLFLVVTLIFENSSSKII